MAATMLEFNRYTIYSYSNQKNEVQYRILCYDVNEYIGQIYFYRDDVAFPENTFVNGNIRLNMSTSRFPHIVDIMRNEKPLYLWIDLNSFNGMLKTDREDVGEDDS